MAHNNTHIPALGHDRLTPLYDPFLRWGMREMTFKRDLVAHADIRPGARVLDLGCGTGTLTILLKQTQPQAEVVGLDGDSRVLAIARSKAAKAGVPLTLDHGLAFDLPYPGASFDRVLTSLMLHHLAHDDKICTFQAVFRVLRPGGQFYILDFAPPHTLYGRVIAPLLQRAERVDDNLRGELPRMMREAGFERVELDTRYATIFGTLGMYSAQKPV